MDVTYLDMLEAMDGISMLIDRDLVVIGIGWRNWNSFWVKNSGGANSPTVMGREVTALFSEGEVRDTYRKLFSDIAAQRRGFFQLEFRCDSPTLRRSVRLSVTPVESCGELQGLLYQSSILAVEQRPAIPLFDAPVAGTSEPPIVRICSVCAKVHWPLADDASNAEWIEPQEYYRRGGSDRVLLSHGFCPPCYQAFEISDD